MTETDVEIALQRTLEKFAGELAKDFKKFILVTSMNHVRTSLDYPQSNCQIKR